MSNETQVTNDNLSKIYDILSGKTAPAIIGKPIFAKDLELAKMAGARTMADVIGKKLDQNDNKSKSIPLNYGSKASTGMLPNETRMRLFYLKKAISDVEIQACYKYKTAYPTADQMKNVPLYKEVLEPTLKAFDVAGFDEWADTQAQARFFFEEYELPLLLADQFDQLPMDAAFVRVPGALGLLMGQLEDDGVSSDFSAQTNTSSAYTVESKNNVVHCVITQDLMDDSSPAIMDKMRKEVLRGLGRSYERSMIDGDTTASHMDSDVVSAKDFRKAFKGFRKLALENEATLGSTGKIVYGHGGDTASKALFAKLLKLMKGQSSEKSDLVWILPNAIAHDLVTGAIPELFTAFAFGGLASNVTGQVPPVFGVQGVESSWVREDLNASGVYGSGETKTCLLLVQKSRFNVWTRQAPRVWAAPSLPSSDRMLMSSKARHSFAGAPQSATEKSVVMGVNIETQGA
jgi:hypothetical protein